MFISFYEVFSFISAKPFLVGLIASFLCLLGLATFALIPIPIQNVYGSQGTAVITLARSRKNSRFGGTEVSRRSVKEVVKRQKFHFRNSNSPKLSNSALVSTALAATVALGSVLLLTNSLIVSLPFACIASAITWTYLKNRETRLEKEIFQVWPEVIDHLMSGIQSGLSLTEALASLSARGPEIIREDFSAFRNQILQSGDFAKAVEELKQRFRSQASDQILEAILLAKSMGGSELLEILRTLGDFLRQDLALRREIEIKHGWIKSSAHLSAVAPWLLLLLLSSQPGTVDSFSQPGGVLILIIGLIMTFLAYIWMGKLGRLPVAPRVFGASAATSLQKDFLP